MEHQPDGYYRHRLRSRRPQLRRCPAVCRALPDDGLHHRHRLIVVTYHFVDHIAAIFTSDAETFWAIRMFIFYAVAFSFFDAAGTPVQGILRGIRMSRSSLTSLS